MFTTFMDRICFKENEDRDLFFEKVREFSQFKSWSLLAKKLKTSRSMLENYRYGKLMIPKDRFLKLSSFLTDKDKDYFSKLIIIKSWNWGLIKGGRAAYAKYPENFKIGRIKGLNRLRMLGIQPKYKFDINMPLTRELCEFIGAFIGDGFFNSYRSGNYLIQFTGHASLDKNYYENVILSYAKLLFDDINPRRIIKENTMRINFYSKNLFAMFSERFRFPKGKKVYSVIIPEEIIKSEEKYLFSTIRGIFDIDGCVYFDKRERYKDFYPRITFQTASYELYMQLKDILLDHFSLYAGERSKRRFYIEIYGHRQLKKWMALVGFSNERHLIKIKRYAPMAQPGRAHF